MLQSERQASRFSKCNKTRILMVDAGLIVLVSFISPFKRERSMARALFDDDEFTEVFVDAPIEECERRDVKVLYAKARAGTVKQFTGIDSPYERPETPDLVVNTVGMSWESCAIKILAFLHARASEKDLKRLRRKERDFSLSK